jgi:pilus assembly protein Flp/PilA
MQTLTQLKNRRRQRGQSMAEYAIIIALIALVCIGAITLLGENITKVFDTAATEIGDAADNAGN